MLRSIDDLFESCEAHKSSVSIDSSGRVIHLVAANLLIPFNKHPFRLYEGERLDDLVASIKANGVMTPIIARSMKGQIEILSGHNRVKGAILAGLEEVPTLILENVSDEDALAYVVETNLIQRSFSDMLHSEKATVIALHHSRMFSQGKRNDIVKQLEFFDGLCETVEGKTSSQVAKKSTTIARIGDSYGLSKDTVARYLRVHKLIQELKILLDESRIAFIPAVSLSYLTEDEQNLIWNCIKTNIVSIDMKKAGMLRQLSQRGKLTVETIEALLVKTRVSEHTTCYTIKMNSDLYTKYFSRGQSSEEVQSVVKKALDMYFSRDDNICIADIHR